MRYFLSFVVGLAIGTIAFALWNRSDQPSESVTNADDRQATADFGSGSVGQSVVAVGRLVPANGVISIAGPSDGRIVKVLVKEGDPLDVGSPLVELDAELVELDLNVLKAEKATAKTQAEAAIAAAKAQKEAAELQLQQAQLQNPQIDSQKQEISVLEANLAAAKKSLEKMEEIPDLVSAQRIEQQQQLVRSTEAQLVASQNNLKQLEVGSKQKVLLAKSDLKLAEANLVKAENAYSEEAFETRLEKAQSLRNRLTIRSPIKGTVLGIALHPGDTIGPRPIMDIANLDPMYCIAEVYESDRALIQEGMSAQITSPAFVGGQSANSMGLTGTVIHVGQMISRTTLDNLDPFKPQDKHVFVVKIELDEQSQPIAEQYINLQVEVKIEIDRKPDSAKAQSDHESLSAA